MKTSSICRMFPKTQYFQVFIDLIRAVIINLAETPIGYKLFKVVPAIIETNNIQEFLAVVKAEIDVNMQQVSRVVRKFAFIF